MAIRVGVNKDKLFNEEKIDKEQMIEDLHFLSDQGNYKSIKYAIKCIEKLEKIEQIINEPIIIPEGVYPKLKKIKEVLEQE